MIRLAEVTARIDGQVPALAGRIGTAGDFANVVDRNQLPQVTPAAYVLPAGLSGGNAEAGAGMFIQSFRETVSVVIVVRVAGDPTAARAIDEASPIVRAVIEAVAGWAPDDAIGIFILAQAELVGATGGALVFQIDFALDDQLRITA